MAHSAGGRSAQSAVNAEGDFIKVRGRPMPMTHLAVRQQHLMLNELAGSKRENLDSAGFREVSL